MSLIYCPECGHEISNEAVACPNCGRPNTVRPVAVKPRVIIADPKPEESTIPKWVIFPAVIFGALFLFLLFYIISGRDDTANSNLARRVNSSSERRTSRSTDERPSTSSSGISTTDTQYVPPSESRTVSVPGSSVAAPQPTVGTVHIDAKVATRTGTQQPVKNAKFYLLDKDIESILGDAGLEPIDGQTLVSSLGISIADPAKYADFYRDAIRALKEHIKYAGSTDGQGKAQLGSVKPESYYLFGAVRSGNGFAMWNSTVSVIAGDNQVDLAPQSVTEMPNTLGE